MSTALPPWLHAYPHGVYAVDTGFHRDCFDAAYLLVEQGRAAFIDTGTNYAVPRLLGALQALGLAVDDVDWVIPTHVHMDHAGGAGLLMSHLPHARMKVHPRGARHMIDPSALWEGATAVYGPDAMARDYGMPVPAPAARVDITHEGQVLELAGRPLRFADTPGHARHHHCVWDEATRGWFTGDTFGLSYPELASARGAWILPTSTPVQFEPEVLQVSIERLLTQDPQCMYITHFGRVTDVPRLGALLLGLLQEMVALGRAERHGANRHEALKAGQLEIFARGLAEHGCTLSRAELAELLAVDLQLNAQGMAVWLDRKPA